MEHITPEQLMSAIVIVLTIFSAIVTIDKVVDIIKKWRSPSMDVSKKLAADKIRLDNHDGAIAKLQESNQVICTALLAILDHELHNGNSDQMQRARDELMQYLQSLMRT